MSFFGTLKHLRCNKHIGIMAAEVEVFRGIICAYANTEGTEPLSEFYLRIKAVFHIMEQWAGQNASVSKCPGTKF